MNTPDSLDDSFQIISISEKPNEEKPGLESLHLPEDLSGKHVLELFSGNEEQSLKKIIEERGGNYTPLDLNNSAGDFTFAMDATSELPLLPESFDYVLMSGPPVYKTSDEIDVGKVQLILSRALPVVKKREGSFVGALMHLDDKNKVTLQEAIANNPTFNDYTAFFEDTGIPATDNFSRPIGGNEWSLRLVPN